ncbi:hypothetical protein AYI86_19155 [Shewanella algae]|nr:hypothetical protein EEY24_19435 [Shewanella algae]TVL31696.1 hypothetical protein AYI94_19680 [Shewanella algae]TVO93203.1 hypothetical protein AYI86_19155 [Shewanella algae]
MEAGFASRLANSWLLELSHGDYNSLIVRLLSSLLQYGSDKSKSYNKSLQADLRRLRRALMRNRTVMHFSEEALIKCGIEMADIFQLPPPSDELFQRKIQEILVDRESYKGVLTGIITKEEAASLILQHFQTLICHSAGRDEASLTTDWSSLLQKTTLALFIK